MSIKGGQITNSQLRFVTVSLRKATDYASTYDYRCPKTMDLQVVKAEQSTTTHIVNESMSTATQTRLSFEILEKVAGEIIRKVPGIVGVTYNIAPKRPSTIEVV